MRWPWCRAHDRARVVPTMFGPARVYETAGPDGEAIRVLEVGGAFQSAAYADGRPEAPFAYLRAFDAAFAAGVPARRALMLGGGAFAGPRHLLALHPGLALDVAEVDPAVVALARERFFLADAERVHSGLRVIVADARDCLRAAAAVDPGPAAMPVAPADSAGAADPGSAAPADPGPVAMPADGAADPAPAVPAAGPYDVIMADVFCGADPDEGLLAPDALALVRAALAPGGVYLANVVVPDAPEGAAALLAAGRALEAAFAHVAVIPCADEGFAAQDNYLLAAADVAVDLPGALPLPPA